MRNWAILLVAVILISCKKNTYENYYSFANNGWNADSIVCLTYTISDTTKKYNLSIKIRHTVDYKFQNLFLFLGASSKDTIEIMLANKSGKWLGEGVSDVREFEYILNKERIFLKKGEYKLRIEQAMRHGAAEKIEKLEHILDVGLMVSEHND